MPAETVLADAVVHSSQIVHQYAALLLVLQPVQNWIALEAMFDSDYRRVQRLLLTCKGREKKSVESPAAVENYRAVAYLVPA